MKYYFMDEDEIKIRSLKNLNTISAVYIKSTNRLIIKCSTEENIYAYDIKHKHFELFFNKLKDTYKKEKDNRKIIILDDELREVLDKAIELPYPKNFIGATHFKYNKINYQKQEIMSLYPIIIDTLSLIFGVQGISVKNISDIKGIRETFSIIVNTDVRERIIPISLKINDDFSYHLTFGNVYGNESVDVDVDFYSDRLSILWKTPSLNICGSINYLIDSNIKKSVEVYYEDIPVYKNEQFINPIEEEIPECLNNDGDYSNYNFFKLDNNLIIVSLKNGLEIDTIYLSETELLTKMRNHYMKQERLMDIDCPVLTMKRVLENYEVENGLVLSQMYFNDSTLEESLYRESMNSQVEFNVYYNNKKYNLTESSEIEHLKCLDGKNLKLIIERKDK